MSYLYLEVRFNLLQNLTRNIRHKVNPEYIDLLYILLHVCTYMYYDIRRMEECRVSLGPTYEEFRYVVSNSGIYFYFDMHRNPRTCSSHLDASSLDFPRNRDLERKLSEGHRISGTTFFLSRLLKCDHRDLEGYTKRWKRGNLRIYIARHQGKRRNATAHYILSEQRAFNGVVNQSQSRTIVRSTTLSSSSSTSRLPTLCERM